jgi:hypothetical protein
MTLDEGVTGSPWTEAEVAVTVEVYFQMLRMQEMGQRPNKAEHNRKLLQLLPARNLQAIEYKHRNISAVLNLFGAQTLSGYKPLPNFQRLLVDVVGRALERDRLFDQVATQSVETPAEPPLLSGFEDFVVEVPSINVAINDQRLDWVRRIPIKRDYLERESRNRSLGLAGELLVMEYEARRLHEMGAKVLAERIEHVSKEKGDGAGYDILSFDGDGRERFIEVKTTAYVAETPFFVTPNEIEFSDEQAGQFQLYRLFSFRKKPQMFVLPGAVSANCLLDPVSYRATPFGHRP